MPRSPRERKLPRGLSHTPPGAGGGLLLGRGHPRDGEGPGAWTPPGRPRGSAGGETTVGAPRATHPTPATTHWGGDAVGAVQGRNTRRLRKAKAAMRVARPQPCGRCGQPIDYDAPAEDPASFTLGHILPWSTHPHLREDPANHRPEHAGCNKSAGARAERPGIGVPSEAW